MRSLRVSAQPILPKDLPRLAVQLTATRQALLSLLTAAIRCVPGGEVSIKAEVHDKEVCVQIRPVSYRITSSLTRGEEVESMEIVRKLVEYSGGRLKVIPGGGGREPFIAKLKFPIVEQITVLAIDDNPDTLSLLQRYVSGTRYYLVGTRDAEQALAMVEKLLPQIIVLDIMLPGVDGWELLGRLREHPKNRGVPIVVCTILPEEELALALGATAFIRKPVSRGDFLSALDLQVDLLAKRSH